MKTRRRTVAAVAALLVVAVTAAVASADASAADRAYTCFPVISGATFSDEHCLDSTSSVQGFTHFLIGSTAEITITNWNTAASTTASSPAVLKGHIAGIETAVKCTEVTGSGSLTNGATSVSGTGQLSYSGCTVTLPAGKGCKVTGGTVTTRELKATTAGTTGTKVKFEPASGTELAAVGIEGCEKERPPWGSYVVEGSLEAPTSGATIAATHFETTLQGRLLFGGTVAGLEGAITVKAGNYHGVTLTP